MKISKSRIMLKTFLLTAGAAVSLTTMAGCGQQASQNAIASAFTCDNISINETVYSVKFAINDASRNGKKFEITPENIGIHMYRDSEYEGVIAGGKLIGWNSSRTINNDLPSVKTVKDITNVEWNVNTGALDMWCPFPGKKWNDAPEFKNLKITVYPFYVEDGKKPKTPEDLKYFYTKSGERISAVTKFLNNCYSRTIV